MCVWVCVCAYVCVREGVCACVCPSIRVCVWAQAVRSTKTSSALSLLLLELHQLAAATEFAEEPEPLVPGEYVCVPVFLCARA